MSGAYKYYSEFGFHAKHIEASFAVEKFDELSNSTRNPSFTI